MFGTKDICVVIVFFNSNNSILDKVFSLKDCVNKILIVDNGSEIEFSSVLEQLNHIDNVVVMQNKRNKGIAYALNQGLKFAHKEEIKLLLTMDQDSCIEKDCIERLAQAIDIEENIISVGPFYDGEEHFSNKKVTNLITSGNIVHVDTIIKLGGYEDKLFVDCVDIDLSFNILTRGFFMLKVARTQMQHKIGEPEFSPIFKIVYLSHSPIRYFYKYRNNIHIYKKYFRLLPKICFKLMGCLIFETVKVIFWERNKRLKIKFAYLGIRQGIGVTPWENISVLHQEVYRK